MQLIHGTIISLTGWVCIYVVPSFARRLENIKCLISSIVRPVIILCVSHITVHYQQKSWKCTAPNFLSHHFALDRHIIWAENLSLFMSNSLASPCKSYSVKCMLCHRTVTALFILQL
jgi:hypothetical protein